MTASPPSPTQLGAVNGGRVHLALVDGALFCNPTRAITHQLGILPEDPGPGLLLDTLKHAMLGRALDLSQACARCVRSAMILDLLAEQRRSRNDNAAAADPQVPDPHGSVQREGAAPNTDTQIMLFAPGPTQTFPELTTVPLVTPAATTPAATATLRGDHEQLVRRCAQLEAHALQARQAADAAEGVREAQAASLADLAERIDQLRCQAADLHNDVGFYAEGAGQRRLDGLRDVTERLATAAREAEAAARGYTGVKPSDIAFPGLPELLSLHGWIPRPDRVMTDDILSRPSTRDHAWVRGWTRGTHTIAVWFTSPRSLSYARCDTRGRLFEATEIRYIITSKNAGEDTPLAPPTSTPDTLMDLTLNQVDAFLLDNGFTAVECQPSAQAPPARARPSNNPTTRRMTWLKPGTSEHRDLRVYGAGRDDEIAVLWYWAGPIRSLAQLARIATRWPCTESATTGDPR